MALGSIMLVVVRRESNLWGDKSVCVVDFVLQHLCSSDAVAGHEEHRWSGMLYMMHSTL